MTIVTIGVKKNENLGIYCEKWVSKMRTEESLGRNESQKWELKNPLWEMKKKKVPNILFTIVTFDRSKFRQSHNCWSKLSNSQFW